MLPPKRPFLIAAIGAALFLMGVASDFFGVVSFAGITKDALLSLVQGNWREVGLAACGLSIVAFGTYLAALRRAAAAQTKAHDSELNLLYARLETQQHALTQASTEASALKAELDDHTVSLRDAFAKYQDLTERCDAVVIQFSRVVEEFVGSGFFVRYTTVSDATEAKAIINALMNPVRLKLTNFQELTKLALQETKNALSESERTALALGEMRQQLAIAQADKVASIDSLVERRIRLEHDLSVAADEVAHVRGKLAHCDAENAQLTRELHEVSERLRSLENATTTEELGAHFIHHIERLETAVDELSQENRGLTKENAMLERLKVRRKP